MRKEIIADGGISDAAPIKKDVQEEIPYFFLGNLLNAAASVFCPFHKGWDKLKVILNEFQFPQNPDDLHLNIKKPQSGYAFAVALHFGEN